MEAYQASSVRKAQVLRIQAKSTPSSPSSLVMWRRYRVLNLRSKAKKEACDKNMCITKIGMKTQQGPSEVLQLQYVASVSCVKALCDVDDAILECRIELWTWCL